MTLVEMAPRIMLMEDPEIAAMVENSMTTDGVTLLTNHTANEVRGTDTLVCTSDGNELLLPFDALLVAVGRKARGADVWKNVLDIELRKNGTLEV